MKLEAALNIIDTHTKLNPEFCVSFEVAKGSVRVSDHFPDVRDGESGFKSEEEAWEMAKKFYKSTDPSVYVNIYVIYGNGKNRFSPVAGYDKKTINCLK